MSVSIGITPSGSILGLPQALPSAAKMGNTSAPFSELFSNVVGDMNTLESQARIAVDGLLTGSGVDVHQAVIATQKAEMGFELALSVRNKAMQAYQSVMGMQF